LKILSFSVRTKKLIRYLFPAIIFLVFLYIIYLRWFLTVIDEAFETLNIPSELLQTLDFEESKYELWYTPGSGFTSRELWVKKVRKIIFDISANDGVVTNISIENSSVHLTYTTGLEENNVTIKLE